MNKTLTEKIITAQKIITSCKKKYNDNLALAWTGGKDSTVLLHIVLTMYGKVPFPVLFNDSTMEFPEIYKFISDISRQWNLKLVVITHRDSDLKKFYKTTSMPEKLNMSRLMKIHAIQDAIKKYKYAGFIVGIRHDEHPSRSNETFISQRNNHIRIHPILEFREENIWEYIKKYNCPYVNLYDQGYRSLGEKPFTKPAKKGEGERSGREPDKEQLMEKIRKMGYW